MRFWIGIIVGSFWGMVVGAFVFAITSIEQRNRTHGGKRDKRKSEDSIDRNEF